MKKASITFHIERKRESGCSSRPHAYWHQLALPSVLQHTRELSVTLADHSTRMKTVPCVDSATLSGVGRPGEICASEIWPDPRWSFLPTCAGGERERSER